MAAADTPCEPWVTTAEVAQGPCAPDVSANVDVAYHERLLAECAEAASTWLYRLSGRRYTGTCTETVRPLWGPCGGSSYGSVATDTWFFFDSRSGTYTPGTLAYWPRSGVGFRGISTSEIGLGYFPVRSVDLVVIDGVPLDPSGYRLDEEQWLVRLGNENWPTAQDLRLSPGDVGTWTVAFTFGTDVPPDGRLAARVLACELAQGLTTGDSRLPARTTNLVRQGVNIALVDPRDLLRDGRFGIPEVDAFLATINPHHIQEGAVVSSVDIPRQVRRVGTVPGS